MSEILLNNNPDEDLAYFLNSNWSAKNEKKGGTRGRGKTMFLAASKDRKILFDSLRCSDGQYVFGEIFLDKDKQIKYRLLWNEDAKQRISEISDKKIEPLKKYGTRIMILNLIR